MADYTTTSNSSFWKNTTDWLLRSQSPASGQARQGRLLAAILLFIELLTIITTAVALNLGSEGLAINISGLKVSYGIVLTAVWTLIYLINRRGATTVAGVLLSAILLFLSVMLVEQTGPMTAAALSITIPVIVAGFFGPPFSAIVVAILAGAAYFLLNLQLDTEYTNNILAGGTATQTLLVYANLSFVAVIAWLFSRTMQQAFQESTKLNLAITEQRHEMEARLQAQTRQLQATTSVARTVAGARNLDQLLEDIVRLIRETFGYYHVQVFLIDEDDTYAVLKQSTGDVGRALLARGHRLPVGSLSVIGQVTASSRPVIARDTDKDFVHRRNELLPLTRSEMAIPLIIGQQTIGALDLQSVEPDAFEDEMIPTFRALADQLAVAIKNAQLFEMAEENLRELSELSRATTQRSWADFLSETRQEERRQVHGMETKAMEIHRSRVVERVLGSGSVIVSTGSDGRKAFLAAPIVVRNEVVGVLGVEPEDTREWSQEDLLLIQGIAERTALAVENARLYLQAQRAANREYLINTIASRLQRAPSLTLLLESATRELSQALGTDNVYAEISMEQPAEQRSKNVSDSRIDAETTGATEGPTTEKPTSGESEEVRA
ncbi:MAG: GAF domain-containing protein [Anaerolineae bacterium]|nr:GAF domain-containing protein [Anaerolineae bacterium]